MICHLLRNTIGCAVPCVCCVCLFVYLCFGISEIVCEHFDNPFCDREKSRARNKERRSNGNCVFLLFQFSTLPAHPKASEK